MAEIKSALELALEKTDSIQADKGALESKEAENKGRKLLSVFLDPIEEVDLKARLKELPHKELPAVKQGMLETFLNHLSLPANEEYKDRLKRLESVVPFLFKDKKRALFILGQVQQFFGQYIENKQNLRENLEQRYGSKLKQKQEELSKQFGSEVHLPPESDPEFAEALRQNMANLEQQYQEALDEVKSEFRNLI